MSVSLRSKVSAQRWESLVALMSCTFTRTSSWLFCIAAFDNVRHAELLRDLPQVLPCGLVMPGRRARNHLSSRRSWISVPGFRLESHRQNKRFPSLLKFSNGRHGHPIFPESLPARRRRRRAIHGVVGFGRSSWKNQETSAASAPVPAMKSANLRRLHCRSRSLGETLSVRFHSPGAASKARAIPSATGKPRRTITTTKRTAVFEISKTEKPGSRFDEQPRHDRVCGPRPCIAPLQLGKEIFRFKKLVSRINFQPKLFA